MKQSQSRRVLGMAEIIILGRCYIAHLNEKKPPLICFLDLESQPTHKEYI